jgi:hypothetical protein
MGKGILFGGLAKCNQELDRKALARESIRSSGLIAGQESASIGKTYWAIFKTFERHK